MASSGAIPNSSSSTPATPIAGQLPQHPPANGASLFGNKEWSFEELRLASSPFKSSPQTGRDGLLTKKSEVDPKTLPRLNNGGPFGAGTSAQIAGQRPAYPSAFTCKYRTDSSLIYRKRAMCAGPTKLRHFTSDRLKYGGRKLVAGLRDLTADRLGSQFVHVEVGSEKTLFTVHRDLICSTSDFFRAAVNGPFKEKDGKVPLLDGIPEAFEVYADWLYTGRICSQRPPFFVDGDKSPFEFSVLAHCCILGDLIQDTLFHDDCIDAMICACIEYSTFPTSLAELVFKSLPSGAPLQRLLVEFYILFGGPSCHSGEDFKNGPAEFWAAVAKGFMDKPMTQPVPPFFAKKKPWEDQCQYHMHNLKRS